MDRKGQLEALQRQMRECRVCPQVERRPIFEGRLENRIMVIGQAPARHRTEPHRPFSQGAGGRKLFRWLAEAGLGEEEEVRAKAYFTSVARCYPGPGRSGHGDEPPSKEQLRNCSSYLEQELDLIRPALLIPVGKMAIERFLGKCPLTEVVGRSVEKDFGGWRARIVSLPHPSGASLWYNLPANQALVRQAIGALSRLREELGL